MLKRRTSSLQRRERLPPMTNMLREWDIEVFTPYARESRRPSRPRHHRQRDPPSESRGDCGPSVIAAVSFPPRSDRCSSPTSIRWSSWARTARRHVGAHGARAGVCGRGRVVPRGRCDAQTTTATIGLAKQYVVIEGDDTTRVLRQGAHGRGWTHSPPDRPRPRSRRPPRTMIR